MAKEKKTKYDTNPLDAEQARRAEEVWGASRLAEPETETAAAEEPWNAEAPTRRYDDSISQSYPSIFVPPTYPPPAPHAPADTPSAKSAPSSKRTVAGIGLPEQLALILPYVPFHLGMAAALIELLMVPRSEPRVRFHAAQGMALQLFAVAFSLFLNLVSNITGNNTGGKLFWGAATVFLIISMIRVWKGQEHHIVPLDDATRWLNNHIDPRAQK
ncbi:MAG TPA: hypothetical protein VF723_08455 [Pyrinomonadaceae bacterium]